MVHADEAGGVQGAAFLWFGGVRLGNEKAIRIAEKKLKRFWNDKLLTLQFWPGPHAIAGYLLDKVDENTFLKTWRSEIPVLETRRLCRANFWIGIKTDDPQRACNYFQQAFSKRDAILEPEYFLAKHEFAKKLMRPTRF